LKTSDLKGGAGPNVRPEFLERRHKGWFSPLLVRKKYRGERLAELDYLLSLLYHGFENFHSCGGW